MTDSNQVLNPANADSTDGPTISARNISNVNKRAIEAGLDGARDSVDKIASVDAGSTDRNVSLRCPPGPWIWWVDTDDRMDAEVGRQIRALLEQPLPAT